MTPLKEYWCYVKFVGSASSTSSTYVVPASDIKDFKPGHPNEFDDKKTYKIFWQEGTNSFDGFYDGYIVCMAASLLELKDKAKSMGIRKMPPNYNQLLKPVAQAASTPKSQKKRSANGVVENAGKRRRMLGVLEQVKTTSPGKSWISSPLKCNTTGEDCEESSDLNETLPVSENPVSENPVSENPVSENPVSENPVSENSLENLTVDELLNNIMDPPTEGGNGRESDTDNGSQSDTDEKASEDHDYSDDDSIDPTAKLMDEIKALRASCKISEEARLKLYAEAEEKQQLIKDLRNEIKFLKEEKSQIIIEKDDKISQLNNEIRKLQNLKGSGHVSSLEENKKLKQLIQTAGELLRTGLDRCSAKRALSFGSEKVSPNDNRDLPGTSERPKLKCQGKAEALILDQNLSETAEQPKVKNQKAEAITTEVKSLTAMKGKKSKQNSEEGLTRVEMLEISEKVRKDILGQQLMPANSDGKIEIGGGLLVSKSRWNDTIKVQPKNSLFITKLGQNCYGVNALKQRTVGQPKEKDGGKIMATPKKVDAFVACLRGKLLAENPDMPNVDDAALAAKVILARKMQDSARSEARSSKKEK